MLTQITQGTRFSGGTRCYWKWNKQTRTTWTQRSERDGWGMKKRWKKLKWNKIFTKMHWNRKFYLTSSTGWTLTQAIYKFFYLWNFLAFFQSFKTFINSFSFSIIIWTWNMQKFNPFQFNTRWLKYTIVNITTLT